MLRRLTLALLALVVATGAQAQTYRPGYGFARPGFQFLGAAPTGNPLYDFTTGAYTNGASAPTVSRASSKYADTLAGVPTLFGANTLARTDRGALVEPAATNLLQQSNNLLNTAWTAVKNGGAVGNATIITQNAAGTAPDGIATSFTLNLSGTLDFVRQPISVASGTQGAISVYARKSASTPASNIRLTTNNTSAWNTGMSQRLALTTAWQPLVAIGTLQTGNSTAFVIIGSADVSGAVDATCTGNIDLAFVQTETGSIRTSYIPTTTATATRPADSVTTTIPAGWTQGVYTLDDNSTQTVTGLTAGSYTLPTVYAPKYVKTLVLQP